MFKHDTNTQHNKKTLSLIIRLCARSCGSCRCLTNISTIQIFTDNKNTEKKYMEKNGVRHVCANKRWNVNHESRKVNDENNKKRNWSFCIKNPILIDATHSQLTHCTVQMKWKHNGKEYERNSSEKKIIHSEHSVKHFAWTRTSKIETEKNICIEK